MKRLSNLLLALLLPCGFVVPLSIACAAAPQEIWQSLEKLPLAKRQARLMEGARQEAAMIWYTNSERENADRYIRAFRRKYPFIDARVWRSKSRQVVQRVIAEARDRRYRVDVIQPSTDLLPALLEAKLLAAYETPMRAIYPSYAKWPHATNLYYGFRVFSFNPRNLSRQDAPKGWRDLLAPRWHGEILFDESSLEEIFALLAAWGKKQTVNYFTRLSQQRLLIRRGRERSTELLMAGEARLAVTTCAAHSEQLRTKQLPVDWVAADLIPTLTYPLALARDAPHPYSAALFYDFLLSEEGQELIAQQGRVVAHPRVEPIYPRMRELKDLLGSRRVWLNTVEQNHKLYDDGFYILDEILVKGKG